ncbi:MULTISPECIES: ComEC/Rec2 family competence protein [unclassified Microcoleus]|uniref:ComEC/Rec2 family competence protein n=1 Tax=unclassified Microcoleus TaxID=2642155 RepID=UPI001D35F5EC|nr:MULTISPECIES: ComEC/Rec2 family competence protein [unclassified Microcoleus]MCC3412171.1 ComEC/Rec2 family competence protein [Microcoleus sp. PH2017_02_FOX_O_A]MCC3515651.1 ComEC/Rec2 family competence protein [Microcoleus sp. PH2017_18_LLB_O_A]
MNQATGVIFCIAYIVGLISTGVSWGRYGIFALGIAVAVAMPKLLLKYTRNSFKTTNKRRSRTKENALEEPLETREKLSLLEMLPRAKWVWAVAGSIAFLASIYFAIRSPQPAMNDISKLIPVGGNTQEVAVTVRGRLASTPRLTRSGRSQFWLDTDAVSEINGGEGGVVVNRPVSGKLYVTVPLLQATGLYADNTIAVVGSLYKPQPPSNPGAFDFQAYLAGQGAFAGLKGRQIDWKRENAIADVNRLNTKTGAFWESTGMQPSPIQTMRMRIVRSQVSQLSVPEGPLISAIALGKQAVDLPYTIRDSFVQAGLAHAIAASGTQVSMVLGLVLALTRRFSKQLQFGFGVGALFLLVGLTGFEASICRAALMGFGTLFALVLSREVKPLGLLLIAGTILLLVNPLWIWNLGFQLSFLATLGLVVTAPPLMAKFDWMPPAIASILVVPIAASVWVLPLLLYVFSVVSPYSILVNIIAAPLLWILSIGGMVSALAGLIFPPAGSVLAQLLDYPAKGLIAIAEYFSQLPGNSVAVGQVSAFQLIALYSLICWVWLGGRRKKEEGRRKKEEGRGKKEEGRRKKGKSRVFALRISAAWILPLALMAGIGVVALPAWHVQSSLFQVTLLATSGEPVLVIQDKGKVVLINSGDENTVRFTVLPFLQQQGVNSVNFAIATHGHLGLSGGWGKLLERLPIKTFYDNNAPKQIHRGSNQEFMTAVQSRQGVYFPLETNKKIDLGSTQLQFVDAEIPVVELLVGDRTWLLVGDMTPEAQSMLSKRLAATGTLKRVEVLWWSGKTLTAELLSAVGPQVAIASSDEIDPETAAQLSQSKTQIFWTGRDGALQWTPAGGFKTTLESEENQTSFL